MPKHNEKDSIFINVVKQMIGKSLKISSTQATGIEMVRSRVPFD